MSRKSRLRKAMPSTVAPPYTRTSRLCDAMILTVTAVAVAVITYPSTAVLALAGILVAAMLPRIWAGSERWAHVASIGAAAGLLIALGFTLIQPEFASAIRRLGLHPGASTLALFVSLGVGLGLTMRLTGAKEPFADITTVSDLGLRFAKKHATFHRIAPLALAAVVGAPAAFTMIGPFAFAFMLCGAALGLGVTVGHHLGHLIAHNQPEPAAELSTAARGRRRRKRK